jgi:hypothetical protein
MMREPTPQEIAKFKRACKALDELGRAGFSLYLANDSMHLMVGESHNERGNMQQEHTRATEHITGAGGGDW